MKVAAVTAHPLGFRARQRPGTRFLLNLCRGLVHAGGGNLEVTILAPGAEMVSRDIEPGIVARTVRADVAGPEPGDSAAWGIVDDLADADVVHLHGDATLWEQAGLLAASVLGKPVCLPGQAAIDGAVDLRMFRPPPPGSPRDVVVFLGAEAGGILRVMERLPSSLTPMVAVHNAPAPLIPAAASCGHQPSAILRLDDPLACREVYGRALAVVEDPTSEARGDAWELPIAEAMACGAPLICRPTRGASALNPGAAAAEVVGWDQLGEELVRLAADPALVARRGMFGSALARERLDLNIAGERLVARYRELLAGA